MIKEFIKSIKMDAFIIAILCIFLGFVVIVWPLEVTNILCIILGVILVISSITHLYSYIRKKDTFLEQLNLLLGLVFGVLGIWIIWKPEMFNSIISVILGVIVFLHGIINLGQVLALKKTGYEKWWISLILSSSMMIMGGLILYNPFQAIANLMTFIGVSLVFDGISVLWIMNRISKSVKEIKEAMSSVKMDLVAREQEDSIVDSEIISEETMPNEHTNPKE